MCIETVLRDMIAGLIVGLVAVIYAFSYAAVIFAGDLSHALSYGIAVTLIAAVVVTGITSILGTIPFGISGPDIYSTLPLAAMVAAASSQLPTGDNPATILAAITSATVITGVGLMLLGMLRGAVVVRYVPYPVFAGFLAATGWLVVAAAVRMLSGVPLQLGTLAQFLSPDILNKLVAAIAFAWLIFVVTARARHFLALPLLLLIGVLATHSALEWFGVDAATARGAGWLFETHGQTTLWTPWQIQSWSAVDWATLAAVLPNMLAVLAVTAIAVVMNVSNLEVDAGINADLNRELRTQGVACVASGGLGGMAGSLSLTRTALNRKAGATGPLAGVICALVAAAVLLAGPAAMSLIPTPVLAGLLIWLGLQFLWKWTVGTRHETNAFDMLIILTILFTVARYGYVAGVAVGVLMACIVFSVRYARVPCVKHHMSLAERRSNVGRSPEATVVLSRLGRSVPILQLQGYLFFGTTHGLQERVKTMLPDARAVVLDFKLVSGLDSSAALGIRKMVRAAADRHAELVFASLGEPSRQELRHAGVLGEGQTTREFDDLDSALEYCENKLLTTADALATERRLFLDWLADELGSRQVALDLEKATTKEQVAPGAFLCREGDPTDSLMFIESGRINVVLGVDQPRPLRLRVIEGRTVLGEIGFYTGATRSASLVADTPTRIYRLSREGYEHLLRQHPQATQALATLVIRVLAGRLQIANDLIAAYER